jgi:hypothetical protein
MSVVEEQAKELGVDAAGGAKDGGQGHGVRAFTFDCCIRTGEAAWRTVVIRLILILYRGARR